MKPRQGLIEIFSSFLNLDSNAIADWIADPRLRRSMQRCIAQPASETSDLYWSLYWHQVWQAEPQSLAADHLSAYIQEACYWSAKKIATNFPSQQSLADLFQTAIVALPKILKSFNPAFGASFKGYAERTFSNVMKESLRKHQQISICSDWALLNKLSQKRLVEALQQASVLESKIAAYTLVWRCYQELYTAEDSKSSRKLETPAPEVWQAIAKLYNTQRLTQLPHAEQIEPSSVEKSLLVIAKAVRAYQSPRIVSSNMPLPGQETGELLDSLPAAQAPLIDDLIVQEEVAQRQAQKAELDAVLQGAIAQLDPPLQTLLQVYYGQDLTQQEIAQRLNLKQYNISRQLTRIRSKLIQAIAQWAQDSMHLIPTPTVLDSMNARLEEWLIEKMKATQNS